MVLTMLADEKLLFIAHYTANSSKKQELFCKINHKNNKKVGDKWKNGIDVDN